MGVGEYSVLIAGVSEPVGESASSDIICEERMRKKKKKRKETDNGNVEEHVSELPSETLSDSPHLISDKKHISGAGGGECSLLICNIPDPVGDSASGDVICEEGMRNKRKKRESCVNVKEEVGKPQSHKLEDNVQQIKYKERSSAAHIGGHSFLKSSFSEAVGKSASGEQGICKRKKKKRKKKDDSENVEEHVNEPPSEILSGSLHLAHNKERNSGVGVGEYSVSVSAVSEPVGKSASCDIICEERMRKKKKKRKETDNGNLEEHASEVPSETLSDSPHLISDKKQNSGAGVGEHSLLMCNIPDPVGDSASGDVICEGQMRNKSKKRESCENIEEEVANPQSHKLEDSVQHCPKKKRKTKKKPVLVSGVSKHVADSASGGVICEERIRKKEKESKKQTDEPPSETSSDSLHLTQDIERSSGAGVCGERSIFYCNVPELGGDSASRDVICEEEIRKLKKKKKHRNGNVEEHVRELPSYTWKESQSKVQDKDRKAGKGEYSHSNFSSQECVKDSASGEVIRSEVVKKKKRKGHS